MALPTEDDDERIGALQKWAKRVLTPSSTHSGHEGRAAPRKPAQIALTLVPLNPDTFKPVLDRRFTVVTKDLSVSGIGLISNAPVDDDLYFAELSVSGQVFLVRKTRARPIQGSIVEYGFQILDRYESIDRTDVR